MQKKLLTIYFLILICTSFYAAEEQQKELQLLQQEIGKYEKQLAAQKNKESATINLIHGLDRQIDIFTGQLYTLRKDIDVKDSSIRNRNAQIDEIAEQIEKLSQLFKKRLITFYKHGRRLDYQLLLSSDSWHQVEVWLRYQKLVLRNDKRNFEALMDKKQRLKVQQDSLKLELAQKEQAFSDIQAKTIQLQKNRSKRQNYLQTIKQDAEFIKHHIDELEKAQIQIKNFVIESERQRLNKEKQISHRSDQVVPKSQREYAFSSQKGNLPWPVKGTIISHFGQQQHPTLKTITENLGVEIKAPLGTPVIAVDGGQIQTITWQRGRGNIVIISHDDGYYTVYTHLADIRVNLMDYVQSGQVIGTVGDSGSLEGPMLHFQIWKNTRNLDPENWLM